MIETVLEFIVEMVFELSIEGLKSKKVPKPIRITIFIFYFLLLFAAIIFCFYIVMRGNINALIKIGLFLLAILLCFLLIRLIRLTVIKQEE